MAKDNNLVFSTDSDTMQKLKARENAPQMLGEAYSDGFLRLKRETKGRKGKGVTTITGIEGDSAVFKKLTADLKKKCGTGGSHKDGVIEIQGDVREKLKSILESMGYKVKLAGG